MHVLVNLSIPRSPTASRARQVRQERDARGGQQRLRRGQGERSQPGSLAPDENNRLKWFTRHER